MHATCPYCDTTYDAEDSEYGRFVKCAVCGKGFVAGTSGTRRAGKTITPTQGTAKTVTNHDMTYGSADVVGRGVSFCRPGTTVLKKAFVTKPKIQIVHEERGDDLSGVYPLRKVILFGSCLAIIAVIVLIVAYKGIRSKVDYDDFYVSTLSSSHGLSYSSGGVSQEESARASIRGALANVRDRYRQNLQRYGLTESYYDETSGICDLMLLDTSSWMKYQIVYYRSSGQIEWPQSMPKSVAELLMQDRMLIDTYEKVTSRK